ncbi:hypothetical protein F5B22DRAFT_661850 [Xylaria bambusicola]|uniref:uncharacterized protein n=1 Tax=Xylaria bambusicola TaxID=326684 RepID=UPI002008822D|nr:uncharacterized protein F5B22DRAFT_661850 [Xylaria bambusicola]KAI0521484.1 hypothetical protein F5B22DRAFT_661850 [Xylaria bambusicola]
MPPNFPQLTPPSDNEEYYASTCIEFEPLLAEASISEFDQAYQSGISTPNGNMLLTPSPSTLGNVEAEDLLQLGSPSIYPDPQAHEVYAYATVESMQWSFTGSPQPSFTQFAWDSPYSNIPGPSFGVLPDSQFEHQPRHVPGMDYGSIYQEAPVMSSPEDQTLFAEFLEDERNVKTNMPYAQYIRLALLSVKPHSMSLAQIYQWFRDNTDKASDISKGWQNSIRHNLSMNKAFSKREGGSESKKSSEWFLEDWAVHGVESTTRYRKGGPPRRSQALKRLSGRNGRIEDRKIRTVSSPRLAGPSNARTTSVRRRARTPINYNFFNDPMPSQVTWVNRPVPAMAPMPMPPMAPAPMPSAPMTSAPMPPQRSYSMPVVRQSIHDLSLDEQQDCLFTDPESQTEGMPNNYTWSE